MNRRSLITASVASLAAGLIGRRVHKTAYGAPSPPRVILDSPVVVPKNFVGMHIHRWPEGNPVSPAPTYAFGTVRSHDGGTPWYSVEPREGQYNWQHLDRWVEVHSAANRTLIYTVYGTPDWVASDTARKDAYGHPGGAAAPNRAPAAGRVSGDLVRRYNASTTRIHFIEIWNEPHFGTNHEGFWWGTASQLATMGRSIFQAAKLADPKIQILSPAFDDTFPRPFSATKPETLHSLYRYLDADTGDGSKGSHWCDAVAIHLYDAEIQGSHDSVEGMLGQVQAIQQALNTRLPIYMTEFGFSKPDGTFKRSDDAHRAILLLRHAVMHAALGCQAICFYSHDDDYIGNPSARPAIAAAIDQLHHQLAGSILKKVTLESDSSLTFTSSRGVFHW
jgi:hypothetical protein